MAGVIVYLAFSIAAGIVSCLWGRRLYYLILSLSVFFAVFQLVLAGSDSSVLAVIIAVVFGAAAALLAKFLYKFSVFLLGLLAGAGLGFLISLFIPENASDYNWIIILAAALICGACAVKWNDLFIIISTAYNGANMVALPACFLVMEFSKIQEFVSTDESVNALSSYLTGDFSNQNGSAILIVTLAICAAGIIFQKKISSK